jgi:hypothetical protein
VTEQPVQAAQKLDRGRRLARRLMGWFSFGALLVEAMALLAGVFLGGPTFVANVTATAPVLVGLFWVQAAIVGAYLGISLTEALKRP